jgi:4-carboxymuconolactone decarboxylase
MADETRQRLGMATFDRVMNLGMDLGGTPYLDAGRDFLFADVWSRPALDVRSRRWITITCACAASTPGAMKLHMAAAIDNGDITVEEMQEFVLQFAAYQGFAKGAQAENLLEEVLKERGLL